MTGKRRPGSGAWTLLLAAAIVPSILGPGCGETAPPLRDCFARIWVPQAAGPTGVLASFSGWTLLGTPLRDYDADWRLLRLELPPGDHHYLLFSDGETRLDPDNPLTAFREDGTEVSLLQVADCGVPAVDVDEATVGEDDRLRVVAQFLAAADASPLAPASVAASTATGAPIDVVVADAATGRIELEAVGLPPGRHTVLLDAKSETGLVAQTARVAAFVAPRSPTAADGVLYQVVVDRFRGDGGAILDPPATPGSRAGGTLDGVRSAIESGYFDALGVTGLWISPVYRNPDEARAGLDGNLYEGYHGYWALDSRGVEPRFGGEAALRALIAAAHARGMRLLLDLVPNHVYEDNPLYLEHVEQAWFQPPGCVCGTASCPWSEHIQDCWFTEYLPDFRFQNDAVVRRTLEDTRFWVHGFGVDGVRIDAVPMMPRAATRRIARDLRDTTFPPESTFLLGEVFTGPGLGALGQLKTHLGPAGLDSVFDFPLMWALRSAIAAGDGDFAEVEAVLATEEEELAGSGAVLGRMLGNHDVSRFISVANGDGGGDPWLEPATQPADDAPYDRQELGFAAIFTLPGMVVLYQGDEIGLAGGSDPDCRRVLPADEALSPRQLALREAVGRLSALRGCSEALRRGDRTSLLAEGGVYAYTRGTDGAFPALVAMSASEALVTVELDPGELAPGDYVDVVSGDTLAIGSEPISIDLAPRSYRIFLRAGDPCAAP